MSWIYYQDQWELNHKVNFDGENKLIIVSPVVSSLDIRIDIYSSWKEWAQLYDYSKFDPALRTTGGDPVGGGKYTGDVYFLINDWKLCYDPRNVAVTGVLYSDDYNTAYWDYDSITPIYPTTVSSIVNTISTGVGSVEQVAEAVWGAILTSYTGITAGAKLNAVGASVDPWNTVLTSYEVAGTAGKVLKEVLTQTDSLEGSMTAVQTDLTTIKNQTDTLETSATNILNAVNSISVSTSAINTSAISFTLTAGTVTTGTYESTRALDGTNHIIRDNATAFDCQYLFDVGLNGIPSQLTLIGHVDDNQEICLVHAWNYSSSQWDVIGNIPGSKTNNTNTFTLFSSHVGINAGEIGDVKIRFTSATISDIFLTIDQMYVSYAVVPKEAGYSGHIVSATSTTIQLSGDASPLDDYYVPSLVSVNHGTGAQQFAKVIDYTGATRTLLLELPMSVILDTTSHITLSPWASATITTSQYNNIDGKLTTITNATDTLESSATQIAGYVDTLESAVQTLQDTVDQMSGLSPQQATMLTEIYNLMGLDPTKPLVVTKTSRTAGVGISQTITGDANTTTVTRV